MDQQGKRRRPTLELAAEMVDSLGSTVDSFAAKMNQQLAKREAQESKVERETKQRHNLMFKALTTIRKALQDTCKIKLGQRFAFEIDIKDYKGWPRIDLRLVDALVPEHIEHALIVSANDKEEAGAVEIRDSKGKVLARVELSKPSEFDKIPVLLKRSVRGFLDQAAQYVMNPPNLNETLAGQTKALDVEEEDIEASGHKISREDLFANDIPKQNSNVIALDEFSSSSANAPQLKPVHDEELDRPIGNKHLVNSDEDLVGSAPLGNLSFEKK